MLFTYRLPNSNTNFGEKNDLKRLENEKYWDFE